VHQELGLRWCGSGGGKQVAERMRKPVIT
jgi:hypothetical protein